MMRVLVTGGSGFLGSHLLPFLTSKGYAVRTLSGLADSTDDLNEALAHIDIVVHLAGIAHRRATDDEYALANRRTAQLLESAKRAGVRQFVFMSSIAAQSDASSTTPLRESDEPRPTSSYGFAKLRAEDMVRHSGILFSILRPVAIWGEGAKGNPGLLQRLSKFPVPLPVGSLQAKRSLVSIQNVILAIHFVMNSKEAVGETFIVADPEPQTLAEMIAMMRQAHGRARLVFPFPVSLLALTFKVLQMNDAWLRMTGPLDARPTKLLAFGWQPETKASQL